MWYGNEASVCRSITSRAATHSNTARLNGSTLMETAREPALAYHNVTDNILFIIIYYIHYIIYVMLISLTIFIKIKFITNINFVGKVIIQYNTYNYYFKRQMFSDNIFF